MQDSLHGKKVTCPKCKSSFVALTEEDRQMQKEHLRIEAEKRKRLQEKTARLRGEKRKGEEEHKKAREEEMANREQKGPAEAETKAEIEREKQARTSRTRNCPDCRGIVSKQAAFCPHCGALLKRAVSARTRKRSKTVVTVSVLSAAIIVGIALACVVLKRDSARSLSEYQPQKSQILHA
jgi:hypothetical protein